MNSLFVTVYTAISTAGVHKYFDLQELTPSTLNDLVKRVEVHQSEK
ncbi:MAG: DUF4368 domain-containing protein, partial [Clostridia bacterium]|nr:DUF4368 domain-containing protein [Clostridia bacterium]